MKVLVTNATLLTLSLTQKPVISEGYVYVSNGVIHAVGEGEPPEELRYPELLLRGEERVIAPGLSSAFTVVTPYIFRFSFREIRMVDWIEYFRELSRMDTYYIAGMAFIEMVMRGITSALVTDVYLDNVARAAKDVGIYVTLAPPFNCGLDEFSPDNELRLLLDRWHGRVANVKAGILTCGTPSEKLLSISREHSIPIYVLEGSEGLEGFKGVKLIPINAGTSGMKSIAYGEGIKNWSEESGLGLGVTPSYSMLEVIRKVPLLTGKHSIDALNAAVNINPKLLGYERIGSIDVGNTANLVLFNTSEPPGWPAPNKLGQLINAVVEGGLRIESVILGDNVLVDSGESITLGYDFIVKARKRIEPLIKKFVRG